MPIRFSPALERVAPDEPETHAEIVATLRSIAETTFRDYGHAVRSGHAKSYALLEGEMTIPELPAVLRGSKSRGIAAH